jgi:hypothetical protein
MSLKNKVAYASKVLPAATWRALGRQPHGWRHLIIALADHFEPAIHPEGGELRVSRAEQVRRLEQWCGEYPATAGAWRDHDGRAFVHTYFYPAEQYDATLLGILADHCHSGWGEVEVHLHHGIAQPDTAENTQRVLVEFRDTLASRHRCLAVEENSGLPRYAFVHGNFALANSAGGKYCGVDSEMKILAETGCYADFTLPTAPLHPSQTTRINSIYECTLPLEEAASRRRGKGLAVGRSPRVFPLIVQGPLVTDLQRSSRARWIVLDNAAVTGSNPMTLHRLALWKQARITVEARPDWLFIKLHCHSMDPAQRDAVIGDSFRTFLAGLVGGAAERKETLHFVTTREMTNIILAACDGKEGNPGDYRDYRLKRLRDVTVPAEKLGSATVSLKG